MLIALYLADPALLREILRQGSFGGGFFRAIKVWMGSLAFKCRLTTSLQQSKRSGKELHDDWEDLPKGERRRAHLGRSLIAR